MPQHLYHHYLNCGSEFGVITAVVKCFGLFWLQSRLVAIVTPSHISKEDPQDLQLLRNLKMASGTLSDYVWHIFGLMFVHVLLEKGSH